MNLFKFVKWGCSSVVEKLPSILSPWIHSPAPPKIEKKERRKKEREREILLLLCLQTVCRPINRLLGTAVSPQMTLEEHSLERGIGNKDRGKSNG